MKLTELDLSKVSYEILFEDLLSNEEIELIHKIAFSRKKKNGQRGTTFNADLNLENHRRSDVIWIENSNETQWLYKKVTDSVRKINNDTYKFDLIGAEPFQYTIYNDSEKGEYDWHNDILISNNETIRKISVSILLSDSSEYKGGSFLFSPSGKPVEIEQEKGRMIVFPSWTPHCVMPVLKGTRVSLVMWLYGKKFK